MTIDSHEQASGQRVSLQKSAECFSRNVKGTDQALGVNWSSSCFSHIKERVWKRLQWKAKLLGGAGTELIVKVKRFFSVFGTQGGTLFIIIQLEGHEKEKLLFNCIMTCDVPPSVQGTRKIPRQSESTIAPLYTMSEHFCDDLNRIMAAFWWRKLH